MPIPTPRGALRRLLLPLLLLSVAPAALAQAPAAVQGAQSGDPAELLAAALRTLSVEPNNLEALNAAGHNALVLGDPNAAVGFFGRAQGIAPRDGRIKAGLGSALVQLEKPQDALRLFNEASRLGVPDIEIAEDRGLAYDLTGDPRKAQRDYQTVLAAHPEDDTARRRLALSQGISGDKAAAIATLDPLIRRRDIAGWRAQTFVLAMTGDTKGASDITHIMLPQQADALQPFLTRLASLSSADKARAVHFGEMPASGRPYTPTQVARADAPATYAGSTAAAATTPASDLAPVRQSAPRPVPIVTSPPAKAVPAPNGTSPLAGLAVSTPPASAAVIAQASPAPDAGLPTPAATGHYDLPHVVADRQPGRPAPVKTIGTPVVHGRTADADVEDAPAKAKRAADKVDTPAPAKARAATRDKVVSTTVDEDEDCLATPVKKATRAAGRRHGKAAVSRKTRCETADAGKAPAKSTKDAAAAKADSVDEGEDCTPVRSAGSAKHRRGASAKAKARTVCASDDETSGKTKKGAVARGTRPAADDADDSKVKSAKGAHAKARAKDDEDSDATASRSAKASGKAGAERVYVQIAGGANRDDLDKAWTGVKKKAPELMKGHAPSTTPVHATNRLLVGPFKDEAEAQAFVNKMAGKGLSGFVFKSGKGQKIEKIDGGK